MSKVFFESFPGSCKNIKTESLEIGNKATVHIAAKLIPLENKQQRNAIFKGSSFYCLNRCQGNYFSL